jgi:glucosylglycerol 3-phosphatase
MEALLKDGLPEIFPLHSLEQIAQLAHAAVLDTQVSPTVNLNGIFAAIPGDVEKQRTMQTLLQRLMETLLADAEQAGSRGFIFSACGSQSWPQCRWYGTSQASGGV